MANTKVENAYFLVQVGQNDTNKKFRVKGSDFMGVANGPEMVLVQRGNDHYWTWFGQPKDLNSPDYSYRFNYYVTPAVDPNSSVESETQKTQPDGDGVINFSLYFEAPGPYGQNEWRNVRNIQRDFKDLDGKDFSVLDNADLKDGDVCRITHEGGDFEAWYIVDGTADGGGSNYLKFRILYTRGDDGSGKDPDRGRTDVKKTGTRPVPDGINVLKLEFYSRENMQPFSRIADTDWVWAQAKDSDNNWKHYKVSGKNFKDLFKTTVPNFTVTSGTAYFNMKMHDTSTAYEIEREEDGRTWPIIGNYSNSPLGVGAYTIPMEGCEWFTLCNSTTAKFEFGPNFNTATVTNMQEALFNCRSFDAPVNHFDMSNCTTTREMFGNCKMFNQSVSEWDLTLVEDAYRMFFNCFNFNGGVTNLKFGAANCYGLFENCKEFNQPLTGLDFSLATSVDNVFRNCFAFNQEIAHLDFSCVNNGEIRHTWFNCHAFNQDFTTVTWPTNAKFINTFANCRNLNHPSMWESSPWPADTYTWSHVLDYHQTNADISNWTQPLPPITGGLFAYWANFNQRVSHLDTSNIERFFATFMGASKFNADDTAQLDVSKNTLFNNMFFGASSFNRDLNNWDTSNGTGFYRALGSTNYPKGIANWNVGNATNMACMFYNTIMSDDLSGWDVSKVTNFYGAFKEWGSRPDSLSATGNVPVFNLNFENWDVRSVTCVREMFYCVGLLDYSEEYDHSPPKGVSTFDLRKWRMPKVNKDNGWDTFTNATCQWNSVESRYSSPIIAGPGFGMPVIEPGVYEPTYTIYGETKVDTSNSHIFASGISTYVKSDGAGIVTPQYDEFSNVISNMQVDLFEAAPGCLRFNPATNYRKSTNNRNWAFAPPSGLSPELVNSPTNMYRLFRNDTRASDQKHYNISGFENINTKNVTDMSYMFKDNYSFANEHLEIDSWDTSNVTNMDYMFEAYNSTPKYTMGDLRGWCVQHIPSLPNGWANKEADGPYEKEPCWGECPAPGEIGSCGDGTNMPAGPWKDYKASYMFETEPGYAGESISFDGSQDTWLKRKDDDSWTFIHRDYATLASNTEYIVATNQTNSAMYFRSQAHYQITGADTANMTNLVSMFHENRNMSADISYWNVSNVTNMDSMFFNCKKFNQELGEWDTRNVRSMRNMFFNCSAMRGNLSFWRVYNVSCNKDFSRGTSVLWQSSHQPQF